MEAPGGSQVLIVDDSTVDRKLLAHALEKAGISCTGARNAAAALEQLDATRYDAVLLDINMPGVNGFELLEKIRAKPALSNLPIIMMSGDPAERRFVRSIELGAIDFFPKPFNPNLIQMRVSAILQERRAQITSPGLLVGDAAAGPGSPGGTSSAMSMASAASSSSSSSSLLRVLIVDDSNVHLKMLSKNLTKAGYAVTLADSGEQALAILQEAQTRMDAAVATMRGTGAPGGAGSGSGSLVRMPSGGTGMSMSPESALPPATMDQLSEAVARVSLASYSAGGGSSGGAPAGTEAGGFGIARPIAHSRVAALQVQSSPTGESPPGSGAATAAIGLSPPSSSGGGFAPISGGTGIGLGGVGGGGVGVVAASAVGGVAGAPFRPRIIAPPVPTSGVGLLGEAISHSSSSSLAAAGAAAMSGGGSPRAGVAIAGIGLPAASGIGLPGMGGGMGGAGSGGGHIGGGGSAFSSGGGIGGTGGAFSSASAAAFASSLSPLENQPLFDFILLDIIMPGIKGTEVLRQLKAGPPSWQNIPVLVMSSLTDPETALECMALGADGVLVKPFSMEALNARINRRLEHVRLRSFVESKLVLLSQMAQQTAAGSGASAGGAGAVPVPGAHSPHGTARPPPAPEGSPDSISPDAKAAAANASGGPGSLVRPTAIDARLAGGVTLPIGTATAAVGLVAIDASPAAGGPATGTLDGGAGGGIIRPMARPLSAAPLGVGGDPAAAPQAAGLIASQPQQLPSSSDAAAASLPLIRSGISGGVSGRDGAYDSAVAPTLRLPDHVAGATGGGALGGPGGGMGGGGIPQVLDEDDNDSDDSGGAARAAIAAIEAAGTSAAASDAAKAAALAAVAAQRQAAARIRQLEASLGDMQRTLRQLTQENRQLKKQVTHLSEQERRLASQLGVTQRRVRSLLQEASAQGYVPSFYTPNPFAPQPLGNLPAAVLAAAAAAAARAPGKRHHHHHAHAALALEDGSPSAGTGRAPAGAAGSSSGAVGGGSPVPQSVSPAALIPAPATMTTTGTGNPIAVHNVELIIGDPMDEHYYMKALAIFEEATAAASGGAAGGAGSGRLPSAGPGAGGKGGDRRSISPHTGGPGGGLHPPTSVTGTITLRMLHRTASGALRLSGPAEAPPTPTTAGGGSPAAGSGAVTPPAAASASANSAGAGGAAAGQVTVRPLPSARFNPVSPAFLRLVTDVCGYPPYFSHLLFSRVLAFAKQCAAAAAAAHAMTTPAAGSPIATLPASSAATGSGGGGGGSSSAGRLFPIPRDASIGVVDFLQYLAYGHTGTTAPTAVLPISASSASGGAAATPGAGGVPSSAGGPSSSPGSVPGGGLPTGDAHHTYIVAAASNGTNSPSTGDRVAKFWALACGPGASYLYPHDVEPLIQSLIDFHPDLAPLRGSPMQRRAYCIVVLNSLFCSLHGQRNGRISYPELRGSNLVDAFYLVASNTARNVLPFSVSYYDDAMSQFSRLSEVSGRHTRAMAAAGLLPGAWLGQEHMLAAAAAARAASGPHGDPSALPLPPGLISMLSVVTEKRESRISPFILSRIFAGYPRPLASRMPGTMTLDDFVWFWLAERDRMSDTSISYWFKCLDVDDDGFLSIDDLRFAYACKLQALHERAATRSSKSKHGRRTPSAGAAASEGGGAFARGAATSPALGFTSAGGGAAVSSGAASPVPMDFSGGDSHGAGGSAHTSSKEDDGGFGSNSLRPGTPHSGSALGSIDGPPRRGTPQRPFGIAGGTSTPSPSSSPANVPGGSGYDASGGRTASSPLPFRGGASSGDGDGSGEYGSSSRSGAHYNPDADPSTRPFQSTANAGLGSDDQLGMIHASGTATSPSRTAGAPGAASGASHRGGHHGHGSADSLRADTPALRPSEATASLSRAPGASASSPSSSPVASPAASGAAPRSPAAAGTAAGAPSPAASAAGEEGGKGNNFGAFNVLCSLIDFINPSVPGRITPVDIKRSGAGPAVFDVLISMSGGFGPAPGSG